MAFLLLLILMITSHHVKKFLLMSMKFALRKRVKYQGFLNLKENLETHEESGPQNTSSQVPDRTDSIASVPGLANA